MSIMSIHIVFRDYLFLMLFIVSRKIVPEWVIPTEQNRVKIIKFVGGIDMEIHNEYGILGTGWAWWKNLWIYIEILLQVSHEKAGVLQIILTLTALLIFWRKHGLLKLKLWVSTK